MGRIRCPPTHPKATAELAASPLISTGADQRQGVRFPAAQRVKAGHALSPADAKALITASQELRLGAAVTLLFCQGWRVSEMLGLAWEDLDLDAGTAQIRRGACYTSSVGMVLGSTRTSGAEGVHYLAPVLAAHLRKRRAEQQAERTAFGGDWRTHAYDGEAISMVFTAVHGGLANRQAVTKEIRRAAKIAGLDPEGLASHSGRRTVVTALYADGGLDLGLRRGASRAFERGGPRVLRPGLALAEPGHTCR